MTDLEAEAKAHLQALTGRPDAVFRQGQMEAIHALVEERRRVLVVERTGWGKSAVYFIATRMLRDRGLGATLLVSPLIALMDNQMEAAGRMGLRAAVVNSANRDDWDDIHERLLHGEIDLLLISEMRLANAAFRREWLPQLDSRVGLLVVDEVHCISDWGHDFRPHYRRIGRFLQSLPPSVPVIGCTATANDRVIEDVESQLGDGLLTVRGPLGRAGLKLEVHTDKRGHEARLAWLVRNIPGLPGSGIVYCLTRRDVFVVTEFLREHGIEAASYMGGDGGGADDKSETLRRFLANDVKCLVATSALGMGYDKPDVGFVVHYQTPQSPIAYYQQVGRAGRDLDESYGILFSGSEDRDIQDWFITQAFPSEEEVATVFGELEAADGPLRVGQLAARVNIGTSRLDNLLAQLEVEGAVAKSDGGWDRTSSPWTYPVERTGGVNDWRREEQRAMEDYLDYDGCRMAFIRSLLDDRSTEPCGICDNCRGERFGIDPEAAVIAKADTRLRHEHIEVSPRKQWPSGLSQPKGRIAADERTEPGWCLTRLDGPGWAPLVRQGRQSGRFADELVDAMAEMLEERLGDNARGWLTFVPSERRPALVSDCAARLAARLQIPVHDIVAKTRTTEPQSTMNNSATQVGNIWGAFGLSGKPPAGPCLLLDDIIDSKWTMTVVAAVLSQAGAGPVTPLALGYAGTSG
ncbi:MAG: RecQ family ATP-dependent DNA helicase [Acidimicrobiaceae bacterium]|nr:RecQ family ATP-dependent DNA helicase [Acidimicrobiaceae bacterium]